jgi:hypothetical protein
MMAAHAGVRAIGKPRPKSRARKSTTASRPSSSPSSGGCTTCGRAVALKHVRTEDYTDCVNAMLVSKELGPRRPNLEPVDATTSPITNVVVELPGDWYGVSGHGIGDDKGRVYAVATGGSESTGSAAQWMNADMLAEKITSDPRWGHREVFLMSCRGADVAPELAKKLGVPVIASRTDIDDGVFREVRTIPSGPDAGRRWVVPVPEDGKWTRFVPTP